MRCGLGYLAGLKGLISLHRDQVVYLLTCAWP